VFDDDRIFTLLYSSAELAIECWRAMPADPENRRVALRLVFDAMMWDLQAGGSELYTLTRDALLKHAALRPGATSCANGSRWQNERRPLSSLAPQRRTTKTKTTMITSAT
jgi:hypothetical protein